MPKCRKTSSSLMAMRLHVEAGTPPIIEVIGLGEALDWMMNIGFDVMRKRMKMRCVDHVMETVGAINRVKIYGTAKEKGAIVSFG